VYLIAIKYLGDANDETVPTRVDQSLATPTGFSRLTTYRVEAAITRKIPRSAGRSHIAESILKSSKIISTNIGTMAIPVQEALVVKALIVLY